MRQPISPIPKPRERAPLQPATVRAALDSLVYSAAARPTTALEHLWLVDATLLDPENSIHPQERQLALQTVLVKLITEELTRHRTALQRAVPLLRDDLPTTLEQISADAGSDNIELLAWSWLYARYVRVDLHITPLLFCAAAHCDERTRRRYQAHGVRRLTERLSEQERAARQQLRTYRLYSELPGLLRVPLVGRADLLAQVRALFARHSPLLLQVTGAAGIGKTTFVNELLRQEIDAGHVTELIWLERPDSCRSIWEIVRQRLPPELLTQPQLLTQESGIVLVLDDLTLLEQDLAALNRLLNGLTPLTVCLLNPTALPITPLSMQVRLDGLPLLEASALLRWLESRPTYSLESSPLPDDVIRMLWETTDGNPAELIREFTTLTSSD